MNQIAIKPKCWLSQLFCKHNYQKGTLSTGSYLHNLRGETITTICIKCGKIKNSTFLEYEGMGYR